MILHPLHLRPDVTARERRELFFGLETMGPRTPETREEAPKPREAITGPREAPRNREEARRAVDELVEQTQREMDRRVRQPLERALANVRQIQAGVEDLPPEDRQKLEQLAIGIQAELDRQNVGGELAYFGITIEYPAGSVRPMKMADGSVRDVQQKFAYGRLAGIGRDGDAADVYAGPDIRNAENVYAVNQGDEIKYMVGFRSPDDARAAYLASHPERTEADVPMPATIPVAQFRTQFGLPGARAA